MSISSSTAHRTRLAPSPTGALHLGNARTFLINWALARQNGWQVVLRIEDLDGPRVKPGSVEQTIELLEWLGFDWDEGPLYQANNTTPYCKALTRLAADGAIYPCACTRGEIQAASVSAPHADDHELRYPGTCRPDAPQPVDATELDRPGCAWRVRVPKGETVCDDFFHGKHTANVQAVVGDFMISTKAGLPSYQLAVVVDDTRQQIDRIVRGNDLLGSTPRQQLLYDLLQLAPRPQYWHVPLVRGPDGRRLAKRHGDTRLVTYRDQGVDPQRVIGLLAEWCGNGARRPQAIGKFAQSFKLENLSHNDVVYRPEDDRWLLGG